MAEPFTDEDKQKVRGCLAVIVVMFIVAAALAYKGAATRGPLDPAATEKCADRGAGRRCGACCSNQGAKSSDILRQGERFICQCFQ